MLEGVLKLLGEMTWSQPLFQETVTMEQMTPAHRRI